MSAVDGNRWLVLHVCVGPPLVTVLSLANQLNLLLRSDI